MRQAFLKRNPRQAELRPAYLESLEAMVELVGILRQADLLQALLRQAVMRQADPADPRQREERGENPAAASRTSEL
jgi:hypothetical protein